MPHFFSPNLDTWYVERVCSRSIWASRRSLSYLADCSLVSLGFELTNGDDDQPNNLACIGGSREFLLTCVLKI